VYSLHSKSRGFKKIINLKVSENEEFLTNAELLFTNLCESNGFGNQVPIC